MQYKEETTGDVVTIESRHNGRSDDTNNTPNQPTVSVSLDGTSIKAQSTVADCSTGTPRFSFTYKIGSGAWSAWTDWQDADTYTISGTAGTTYYFKSKVRCDTDSTIGDVSNESAEASYTYSASAPAGPSTPTLTYTGTTSVTATVAVVTCSSSGSSAQYALRKRTNGGTWEAYTAWSTGRTITATTSQGVKYGFQAKARCYNSTTVLSSAEVSSSEVSYTRPIDTPAAPIASLNTSTKYWSWSTSTCGGGTAVFRYRFRTSTEVGAYSSDVTVKTIRNAAATSQGISYGINVQQKCTNTNTTSGWSADSNNPTFSVPVVHAQLRNWAMKMNTHPDGGIVRIKLKTFSRACASGLVRETKLHMTWNTPGKNSWVDASPWFTSADNSERNLVDDTWAGWVAQGEMVETRAYTRCRNTTTNAVSDASNSTSLKMLYDIGNIRYLSDGRYNISCAPNSMQAYCAGGYNASGTQTSTSSGALSCAVRDSGIVAEERRFTARFNLGANNPCWNA